MVKKKKYRSGEGDQVASGMTKIGDWAGTQNLSKSGSTWANQHLQRCRREETSDILL